MDASVVATVKENCANVPVERPIDAWIDAIPEDPYAICPCGCGMKWRFAVKENVERHERRFIEAYEKRYGQGGYEGA